MAKYKKMAKSPGRRDPELQRKDLMIENTNQRAYDLNVPGLFDDEEALELDTGELVAASVEPEWLPNGVALHAWLRWMNEDGSSKEVHGKPIELSLSHSFDHETLRRHSLKALAKEMVQVMLGEPPTMTPVHVDSEDQAGLAPDQVTSTETSKLESLDPGQGERPLIGLSEAALAEVQFREAVKRARAAERLRLDL